MRNIQGRSPLDVPLDGRIRPQRAEDHTRLILQLEAGTDEAGKVTAESDAHAKQRDAEPVKFG